MPNSPRHGSRTWSRLLIALALSAMSLAGASCTKQAPPPPPAPPPPAAPAVTAAPADAGSADAPKKSKLAPAPTDGLSLAERMERRKANDAKLAAQLAAEEQTRLLEYDHGKIKQHEEIYGFIKKTRAALDAAKGKEAVANLQAKQNKAIVAEGKKVHDIDPKGGNSNIVTDEDVMLNALANDYPEALMAAADGDKTAITEQRAELDKRDKKIDDWLKQLKADKGGKGKAKKK
jgi:hypothetical protein